MKITFVLAAADLSGGNRVISIYAKQLTRRGHQVTVVSRPRRPVTLKDKWLAWIRNQAIPKNQKHWPSHFSDFPRHIQVERYRSLVADDLPDADVVIATWWETAEWVAALPPNKGRHVYFIQHHEIHPGQDALRVEATWKLPMRKIAVAKWLIDRAQVHDIALVPNAVSLDQFNAPPRSKQSVPTVGVMYSVIPFKGFDISLKAYKLAKRNIPNLKMVAFGNRAILPQLPLPAGTVYTMQPAQDQIKNIYSSCDIWLVGSRSEGFGLPILEAMACRTPVIATLTGAAPELLAAGGGALVPTEDPAAMALEIIRIASLSDADWRAMSEIAHQTATQYTWDDATDLFEAVIQP